MMGKRDLIVIILTLILCSLLLVVLTYFQLRNTESRGVNNLPTKMSFEVYIVNNATTINDARKYVSDSNNILEEYNISTGIVFTKEISLGKNDTQIFFSYGNNEHECMEYNRSIELISNNSKKLKIIFVDKPDNSITVAGISGICSYDFVMIEPNDKILEFDFGTWNVAHELGHLYGLVHTGRYNLMNYRLKSLLLRPDYLNQTQVDTIMNNIKIRNENKGHI